MKRAQRLGNVHNIPDTCTTSLERAHLEYLKTLVQGGESRCTHIYIYMYVYVYVYAYVYVYVYVYAYVYVCIYVYM